MKKRLYLLLVLLILINSQRTIACIPEDCSSNSINSVGLDEGKYRISNFFEEYLSHVVTKEGKAILYIESDDGTFSDHITLLVGETKTFHGETITLVETMGEWNPDYYLMYPEGHVLSTFVRGGLPACYKYCFPVHGDSYCGLREESTYHWDCDAEHCGDGVCEDYDRRYCREDCAEDFCGDSRCEDFEVGVCTSDCPEATLEGPFNYGGYILKGKSYEIDGEHSIRFMGSNFDSDLASRGITQMDLKGTFQIFKGGNPVDEFELEKSNVVTQPLENVDYAFQFLSGEAERALLDIFRVKEIKDEIKLNYKEGFFCDDAFITLVKSALVYPDPFSPPVVFKLESVSGRGIATSDLVTCNDCIETLDDLNNLLQKKKDSFTCEGLVPTIKEFSLEGGYVVLAFPPGSFEPDECSSDVECDDKRPSTEDSCAGTPKKCLNTPLTECRAGDDYCPQDCLYGTDADCGEPGRCVSNSDCNDNDPCSVDRCEGTPKKCVNERTQSGCNLDDDCVSTGTRTENRYCSPDKQFNEQQTTERACSNDYECVSNNCVNNQCMESNLIRRLINWLKNLLGVE